MKSKGMATLTNLIAYAIEREQSACNSFAQVLDDHDIDQVLPVRGDQYELGASIAHHVTAVSHTHQLMLAPCPARGSPMVT